MPFYKQLQAQQVMSMGQKHVVCVVDQELRRSATKLYRTSALYQPVKEMKALFDSVISLIEENVRTGSETTVGPCQLYLTYFTSTHVNNTKMGDNEQMIRHGRRRQLRLSYLYLLSFSFLLLYPFCLLVQSFILFPVLPAHRGRKWLPSTSICR